MKTVGALPALPIQGHRADFEIHPPTFRTRATCECGWRGDWWDRADEASSEWRDHVGIVA